MVRINKGDLVNTLTLNRKKHSSDYKKACEGYRDTIRDFLNDCVGRLSSGENVLVVIRDTPPVDHTDEYDVALKMLEMSVDGVIELTHEEFRHMVLDDWEWQRHWKAVNMKYISHNE